MRNDPRTGAPRKPLVLLAATPGHEESVLEGLADELPGAHVFGGSAGDAALDPAQWRVAAGRRALAQPAIAIALLWPSVGYKISINSLSSNSKSRFKISAKQLISEWHAQQEDVSVLPKKAGGVLAGRSFVVVMFQTNRGYM